MGLKIDINARSKATYSANDLSGLFGGVAVETPVGKEITELEISRLAPYANQPFKAYRPEKLELLAADIKENGVLSPIIVRPMGAGYEILAGHNRTSAAKKAGLKQVPAIIVEADDNTAALIMVNTNLNQREELLPSEKAFAYKIQLEAMKKQGQRNDLTSRQNVGKSESADTMGEYAGKSGRQIQRYIRLTYLIPELLEQVDSGELSVIPAVSLSYLTQEEQLLVLDISADCQRKISVFQSNQLKKSAGKLDMEVIRSILLPGKEWNPRQQFASRSSTMIPGTASPEDVTAVLALIAEYFRKKEEG